MTEKFEQIKLCLKDSKNLDFEDEERILANDCNCIIFNDLKDLLVQFNMDLVMRCLAISVHNFVFADGEPESNLEVFEACFKELKEKMYPLAEMK